MRVETEGVAAATDAGKRGINKAPRASRRFIGAILLFFPRHGPEMCKGGRIARPEPVVRHSGGRGPGTRTERRRPDRDAASARRRAAMIRGPWSRPDHWGGRLAQS